MSLQSEKTTLLSTLNRKETISIRQLSNVVSRTLPSAHDKPVMRLPDRATRTREQSRARRFARSQPPKTESEISARSSSVCPKFTFLYRHWSISTDTASRFASSISAYSSDRYTPSSFRSSSGSLAGLSVAGSFGAAGERKRACLPPSEPCELEGIP